MQEVKRVSYNEIKYTCMLDNTELEKDAEIKLFEFDFQKDLKQAYDNGEKKNLSFSLGYNSAHGESNLLTARNK